MDVKTQLAELFAEAKNYSELRRATPLEECLDRIEGILDRTDDPLASERASLNRYRAIVHFLRDEFELGIKRAEQALAEHQRLGDDVNVARSIMIIGNCLNHAGKYSDSIRYHLRSSEMLSASDDIVTYAWSLINVAVSYLGLGDYPQSLSYVERAYASIKDSDDDRLKAYALTFMATPNFFMGDYASVMRCALEAFHIGKRAGFGDVIRQTASNISYTAFVVGALDIAQKWSDIAADENLASESPSDRVNDELNRTMLRIRQHPTREAAEAFEQHLDELYARSHLRETTQSAPFLADLYLELDDITSAQRVADIWNERVREMEFQPGVITLRRVRLDIAARLGAGDELVDEAQRILEHAEETKSSQDVEETLKILAQLHRDRREFEDATRYYERYLVVREENVDRRSRHSTEMAQIQFDHERLDQLSEKQQDLLSSVMPDEIVDRLMSGEENIADAFDDASVMFLDLVSFTDLSSSVPPAHLIHLLNAVFSTCDDVVQEHGLTKIKTIGDSYLAVSGLPHPQEDHAQRLANAALDLLTRLKDLQVTMPPELGDTSWVNSVGDLSIRIGLHCGPVVAGVIGRHRAQYDVWGDTVNTASRMESTGQPDRIHISEDFAMKIAQGAPPAFEGTDVVIRQAPYLMRLRGTTSIKGKGEMKTFWLEGA